MAKGKTLLGVDAAAWGLTLLAVSEVPNFLAGMAPSLFTLQHMTGKSAQHNADARDSMRRAYVVGGAMSMAVGLGASLVAETPVPFVACGITLAVLISQYEYALNNPHTSGEEMFNG